MKKWINLTLIVLWITIIFSFSMRSGGDSHTQSLQFETILAGFAHRIGADRIDLSFVRKLFPGSGMSPGEILLRKAAHFGEYLVLGLLTLPALRRECRSVRPSKLRWALLLLGTAVAVVDEKLIQAYLSTGRTSSWGDVLIDSAGFLTGMAVLALLFLLAGGKKGAVSVLTPIK